MFVSTKMEMKTMTETKIEFKCLKCGNYYDPNINLECPVCGKKQKLEHLNSMKSHKNSSFIAKPGLH